MKFFIGSAISALQNEGSNDSGGTNWDISKLKNETIDKSTPNLGSGFLIHYEKDLDFLLSMNMKDFRLSIMWSRLMPDGINICENGVKYYNDLLNACKKRKIKVNLTIFHWDTPKKLQDLYGGWANDQIIKDFTNYAKTVIQLFGDKVDKVATMNEIICFTWLAHSTPNTKSLFPIGEDLDNDFEKLKTIRRALLAHAYAFQEIKKINPKIKIGIVDNPSIMIPLTYKDKKATKSAFSDAWLNGAIIYPLLTGKISKNFGKTNSCNGRGKLSCNVDFLNKKELKLIKKAKPEWLGLNVYSGQFINNNENIGYSKNHPFYFFEWLKLMPNAAYYAAKHIRKTLNYKKDIYITESGCPDDEIIDTARIIYLEGVINAIKKANEKKYNIKGLYVWTLTDNWEWTHGGLKAQFGLAKVNFKTFERTPRKSSEYLKNLIIDLKK